MRFVTTFSLVAALAMTSAVAHAQSASTNAAELFEQGRVALAAKDYKTACAKLEASLALERAVGTLISLATCEEGLNKLASARQHWKEAEDLAIATHDKFDRAAYAQKHAADLQRRVPQVTITVKGDLSRVQITRDGVNVPASALGTPLHVDPGSHTFTVDAPSRKPTSLKVDVAEGERKSIVLSLGEPIEEKHDAPPVQAPPAEPANDTTLRTVGYASGGVGVVALGVGIAMGLVASSKWSDAQDTCGAGCAPTSPAYEARDDARTFATVSTISFVAAGALLATAAVLILVSPRPSTAARSLLVLGTF